MPQPYDTPAEAKLAAALALAADGFCVFPLLVGGKTPAISAWNVRASYDPEKVRRMWASWDPVENCERVKNYNVGIATGRTRDGYCLILDVDIKGGKLGAQSLEEYDILAPAPWLNTRTVTTASGGTHYYFESDGPLASSVSRIKPGLDTRGHGGFVVAGGSVVAGGTQRYTDHGGAVAAIPTWLAADIGKASDRGPYNGNVLCILDTDLAVSRATNYLAFSAGIAVQGAGGNSKTYQVAQCVKDYGMSEQGCTDLLFAEWNDRCVPPWEYEELAVVVSNAYSYGQNPPGILHPEACFADEVTDEIAAAVAAAEAVAPTPLAEVAAAEVVAEVVADVAANDAANDAALMDLTPPPKPPRFKLEAFADISPDLARRDLIKGVMLRVGTVGLIGAPNAGKSQAEAHLAYAIASGDAWCGRRVMAGAVVCALGEGAEGFRGRVKAIRDAYGGTDIPFYMVAAAPNLLDVKDVGLFVATVKTALKNAPELRAIFIDTMTTATPGGDQNSTETMSRVVSSVRAISTALDCAVVIIHHTGKDATKGARGSSVFNGDLDTELLVEATGDGRFCIKQTKQRDFEKGAPFRFKQRAAVIGRDADGDDVTAVFAEWDESEDLDDSFSPGITAATLTPQQKCLVEVLEKHGDWVGREWLRPGFIERWLADNPKSKQVSVAANFRRIVAELVAAGLIEQDGEDRHSRYRMKKSDEGTI